jgi:hypothetical protein
MAEIELSVLSRQCLERRVPDFETLQSEAQAWQDRRDETGTKIDWRFTTEEARNKLKRLYPSFQEYRCIEGISAELAESFRDEAKARLVPVGGHIAPRACPITDPRVYARRTFAGAVVATDIVLAETFVCKAVTYIVSAMRVPVLRSAPATRHFQL